MSEVERIGKLMRRGFEGRAWHGPSLLESLAGVGAQVAAAPSPGGAHSIWQIAQHATTWKSVVCRFLAGEQVQPNDDENWPLITDVSDEAWQEVLDRLRTVDEQLRAAVAQVDDAQLDGRLFKGMPRTYQLLHGVIHHDIYHAGQIALLRKMHGIAPALG